MNPFDWTGPTFLAFYAGLLTFAVVAALVLRWHLRTPDDEPTGEALHLSPYEAAYLAGRETAAIDAALVRLVHRNVLAVNASTRQLSAKTDKLRVDAPDLEKVLFGAVKNEPDRLVGEVRTKANTVAGKLRKRLDKLGLVVDEGRAILVRVLPAFFVWAVALVGLIKIAVGSARNRPIGFLVVLVIVTVIIGIAFLAVAAHRSRRGDRALALLKEQNAALETVASRRVSSLADDELVLATGLFGMGILVGGPLADLRTALRPPPSKGGSSCGSCGSSCSSGGGCGGGCGGGGCGGCGS